MIILGRVSKETKGPVVAGFAETIDLLVQQAAHGFGLTHYALLEERGKVRRMQPFALVEHAARESGELRQRDQQIFAAHRDHAPLLGREARGRGAQQLEQRAGKRATAQAFSRARQSYSRSPLRISRCA